MSPILDFIAAARDRGIATVVDGAQAVPHMAVDVQALGCDAMQGYLVSRPTDAAGIAAMTRAAAEQTLFA